MLLPTAHTALPAAVTIPIQPAATRTGAEPGLVGGRGAGLEEQPDRPLSALNSQAAYGRLCIWRHPSEVPLSSGPRRLFMALSRHVRPRSRCPLFGRNPTWHSSRTASAYDPKPTNRNVCCQVRAERGAYQHLIGSRASASCSALGPTPTDGWACHGLCPGFREGSGSVLVRTLNLDLCQDLERPAP